MNENEKLEMTRRILINAINNNISNGLVLKISEKLDKHIVDYYLKSNKQEEKQVK